MGSVNGVTQTITELRKFGKEAEKVIAGETEAAALSIEEDAKKRAPKNFGKLAQSISTSKINPTNYKVTVNELYGAYVEFGTGLLVKVPPEFEAMANSYKGKKGGTFQDFIDAMTIWFKAKGYDTKNVWIACINKINNGSEPQPFLYPAWIKGKKDYEKRLKLAIKQFNKKI